MSWAWRGWAWCWKWPWETAVMEGSSALWWPLCCAGDTAILFGFGLWAPHFPVFGFLTCDAELTQQSEAGARRS